MRFFLRNADIFFVSLFVIGLGIMLALLPNPTGLDDSLRHSAMGKMMLEHGMMHAHWSDFLFWGTMSRLQTDPWFLYDVLMMQFARFPTLVALDLNVFFSVSALAVAGFAAIRSLGLKSYGAAAFLWLLLLGDQQFFARMMIGRPFTLQTAIALGVFACVLKRRYVLLALLIALSVLISQLFVFALFFSVVAVVWSVIARTGRDAARLAFAAVTGVLVGFSLHPFPLEYLRYVVSVFLQIPLLSHHIHLSREMQPSLFDISMMSVLVAVGACILLVTLFLRTNHSKNFFRSDAFYPVSLAVLFLPIYFMWIRGLDLLWPVLVLSVAALFFLLRKDVFKTLPLAYGNSLLKAAAIILVVFQSIAYPAWFFIFDDTRTLQGYSAALEIPDGAQVLDMDWTQFSPLVLLQPSARYATGIDPSFLYLTDPQKYQALYDLEYADVSDADARRLLSSLMRDSAACIVALPSNYPTHVVSMLKSLPRTKEIARSNALIVMQTGECAK